jgi:hypothetical protein
VRGPEGLLPEQEGAIRHRTFMRSFCCKAGNLFSHAMSIGAMYPFFLLMNLCACFLSRFGDEERVREIEVDSWLLCIAVCFHGDLICMLHACADSMVHAARHERVNINMGSPLERAHCCCSSRCGGSFHISSKPNNAGAS